MITNKCVNISLIPFEVAKLSIRLIQASKAAIRTSVVLDLKAWHEKNTARVMKLRFRTVQGDVNFSEAWEALTIVSTHTLI